MSDNTRKRDSNEPDIGDAAAGSGAASTNLNGIGNTAGMGAGAGYDTVGELGSVDTAAEHPNPNDAYETSSVGRGKGQGRDGANPGAMGGGMGGGRSGGGTGGMTGVGGAGSRQGLGNVGTGGGTGHANDIAPTAGGVAVSGGRGSDVGDADHGLGRERGGMSGGSFGGSGEQETGGGLGGAMRGEAGADASGGRGGSRGGKVGDPNQGGADVSTDHKPGGVNERVD